MTKLFECTICQRSFTNGKALGGHKSSHKRRSRSNALQIQNMEATFMCPVCSKGFVSARSVYGHMKKHSDRSWRGMIPPAPKRQYDCTVCGRGFQSYQALGGHKSHHVRTGRVGPMEDGQDYSGVIVPYIEEPSCSRQLVDHGQIMSSGEALGNHRSTNGNEVIPCNGGDQETRIQGGGFRFDLNKLPSEWTE